MTSLRTWACAACLGLLAVSVWCLTHQPVWVHGIDLFVFLTLAWAVFAASLFLIRRVPRRAATALILLGGIGLPLAAGFAPPRSSDDLYRYLWDGKVQTSGVDPYRYAPAAPELVPLRDDFLWPEQSTWCVPTGATDRETSQPLTQGCTLINRPDVHTIYPPAAQAYFTAVHALSPRHAGVRPIQLAGALVAVATTILLLLALAKLGLDSRLAAIWAWCPLVALEAANNAHVDVVAAFLTASTLVVLARARSRLATAVGGALLGLAVAVKLTPALVGPSLLRRHPFLTVAGAAGAIAAAYLPHVLAVGPGVLGFLPGYLGDEGYTSGGRFTLLTMILPAQTATLAAAAVIAVTAILVWWRSNPDRPWDTACVMVGVALLVATPHYSWYAILLVMLVAFTGRYEWLTVAAAGYVAQYSSNLGLSGTAAQRWGYGIAALVIVGVALARLRGRNVTKA